MSPAPAVPAGTIPKGSSHGDRRRCDPTAQRDPIRLARQPMPARPLQPGSRRPSDVPRLTHDIHPALVVDQCDSVNADHFSSVRVASISRRVCHNVIVKASTCHSRMSQLVTARPLTLGVGRHRDVVRPLQFLRPATTLDPRPPKVAAGCGAERRSSPPLLESSTIATRPKLSSDPHSHQFGHPQTASRNVETRRQLVIVSDAEIRQRLRLGEHSAWEFKQIEFTGDRPTSPRREDLADEMAAFANANGGVLLCGVTDDGQIQGVSQGQMATLDRLLVEVSTGAVEPALRIDVHHRTLDNKALVLVQVSRGDAVHERSGRAFIRVGATQRRLDGDERLRLAQRRAQSRYLWFDRQVVPQTGFETLAERLWEPLLSVSGAADPRRGLMNLRLLAQDESGVDRATVAGVLLCAQAPEERLSQATIVATHHRGQDRASGQLDAQEISGPLPVQIADAVKFVVRNMRVAARKMPEREDLPQYSVAAVFEAVVNAVVTQLPGSAPANRPTPR